MISNTEKKQLKDMVSGFLDQVIDYANTILVEIKKPKLNEVKLQEIDNLDQDIDNKYHELIDEFIWIINKKRPLAIDLRRLICYILNIKELERIADGCNNVARNLLQNKTSTAMIKTYIIPMYEKVLSQMKLLAKTIVKYKVEILDEIKKEDSGINNLYHELAKKINQELLQMNDTAKMTKYAACLILIKNLERTGDHIVNICREISYIYEGNYNDSDDE